MEQIKKIQNERAYRYPEQNHPFFCASIRDSGIFINDIEIINRRAKLQFATFEIFMEHYFYSVVMRKNTYEPFLTAKKLSTLLEKRNIDSLIQEDQIRRALKTIRKTLVSRLNCDKDHILETIPWNGYRLNPAYVKLG